MQNTHLASVYECSSLDKRVGEWCKNHAKYGLSSHTAFCQTFPKGIKKKHFNGITKIYGKVAKYERSNKGKKKQLWRRV